MSLQCKVQYQFSRPCAPKRQTFLILFYSPHINQSNDIKIFWSSCKNLDILVILSNGSSDVTKQSSIRDISRTAHCRHINLYIFGISVSRSNHLTPLRLCLSNLIFLPYPFGPFFTGRSASYLENCK